MRVLFMGNHTVGVSALEAILEQDEVVGVVAHPPDAEDGLRYLSVYEFARARNLNVVRMKGRSARLPAFMRQAQPDVVWITDYRYLLPSDLLSIPPLGTVNLHPSLLPKYRGRAPVNWAIIHGERQLGLTAHFVDQGMDTGDIIAQLQFTLREDQDVGDALQMLMPLYKSITRQTLAYFRTGQVPRQPQDHSQATAFPRRRPKDGLIDWNQSAKDVHNLIRAVAKPYPGAFSFYKGKKLMIWSASVYSKQADVAIPGQVLSLEPEGFVVCTGKGAILVKQAEFADSNSPVVLASGERLESLP